MLSTPATSLNPPSTADVQAPHVMPSTARVVVVIGRAAVLSRDATVASGMFVESTSASNPRSSMISATFSADNLAGS